MADFQLVLKERERMCDSFCSCMQCPLWSGLKGNMVCRDWTFNNPAEAEKIIMQWSKEHPVITNRRKFEQVFGFNIATLFEVNCRNVEWLDKEYKEYKEKNDNE